MGASLGVPAPPHTPFTCGAVQSSFRGLLRDGQLEDREATFELPASVQKMQPFDGMGGIAVHELISGYDAPGPHPPLPSANWAPCCTVVSHSM